MPTPPSTINCNSRNADGFTLLEISIVLVIIGLIVGGIMIGKNLIESYAIHAQISQIEQFKTATYSFKLKYGYLPGDIPPTQTSQLGFFTFTGSYAGQTYFEATGDSIGDLIRGYGNASGVLEQGEFDVFWKHLSEAKMIDGQYGGVVGGVNYLLTNTNALNTAGKPIDGGNLSSDEWNLFRPQSKFSYVYNHIEAIGNKAHTNINWYTKTSLFNLFRFRATPRQELAIDSKIDDTVPYTGIIRENSAIWGTYGEVPCIYNRLYDLRATNADMVASCKLVVLW